MANINSKLKSSLKILLVVFTFSFLVFNLATPAFAIGTSFGPVPQTTGLTETVGAPGPATQRLLDIIGRLTNWMVILLFALTVVFIVYAGYLYLTAAGNEDQLQKAKQIIIYSVVAVGVALLAYVFISVVKTLVGK